MIYTVYTVYTDLSRGEGNFFREFLCRNIDTTGTFWYTNVRIKPIREDIIRIVSKIEQLRDPCIVVENGVYYAYGTGWVCYKNTSGSLAGDWNASVR